jgi:hypothetical protein
MERKCAYNELGIGVEGGGTYIVNVPAEVEQDRFRQFATVDPVVLVQLVVRKSSRVDVHKQLLVIWARLDRFTSERDKVVQGGEHLYLKTET